MQGDARARAAPFERHARLDVPSFDRLDRSARIHLTRRASRRRHAGPADCRNESRGIDVAPRRVDARLASPRTRDRPIAVTLPPAIAARDSPTSSRSPSSRTSRDDIPDIESLPCDAVRRELQTVPLARLSGPLTVPSTCTLPRGASSAWPHHFAAFWQFAIATDSNVNRRLLPDERQRAVDLRSELRCDSREGSEGAGRVRRTPRRFRSCRMRVLVDTDDEVQRSLEGQPPARRQIDRERRRAEGHVRGLVAVLDRESLAR